MRLVITAEYPTTRLPRTVLAPLHRGSGDPCYRVEGATVWLTGLAPEPFTARLDPGATATFWGPGAAWAVEHLPQWLGADDDTTGFACEHPLVSAQWRRYELIWRVPRTVLTWQIAVAAVLEQRVTGVEARGAWRRLVREHGEPAPGPRNLFVPPTPEQLLAVPSWDWRRYEVDRQRVVTLRELARTAHVLDRAADLIPAAARESLRVLPGVGVWTAAEISARAFGDADSVSFGDYHLARNVTYALTGRENGTDDDMAALLAPYSGHRHRVVRMVELAGVAPPRRGPRMRLPGPR